MGTSTTPMQTLRTLRPTSTRTESGVPESGVLSSNLFTVLWMYSESLSVLWLFYECSLGVFWEVVWMISGCSISGLFRRPQNISSDLESSFLQIFTTNVL